MREDRTGNSLGKVTSQSGFVKGVAEPGGSRYGLANCPRQHGDSLRVGASMDDHSGQGQSNARTAITGALRNRRLWREWAESGNGRPAAAKGEAAVRTEGSQRRLATWRLPRRSGCPFTRPTFYLSVLPSAPPGFPDDDCRSAFWRFDGCTWLVADAAALGRHLHTITVFRLGRLAIV